MQNNVRRAEPRQRLIQRWFQSKSLRLASSLCLLVLCTLFFADVLSLRGHPVQDIQDARKVMVEAFAMQLSPLVGPGDEPALKYAVSRFVESNESVLAASLKQAERGVLATSGDTASLEKMVGTASSTTHLIVPLFQENLVWGTVNILFKSQQRWLMDIVYFGFLAISCFVVFFFFLKSVLLQLDPGKAVPDRVNTAFNLFSEGVVILDPDRRIVLANNSAAAMIDTSADAQIGKSLNDWGWVKDEQWMAPWDSAIESGDAPQDFTAQLECTDGRRLIVVSCTLLGDVDAERRGVMVTLNDKSDLHRKNDELTAALSHLEASERALAEKNDELQTQATTDPLSGLMNRRALLTSFAEIHEYSRQQHKPLVCIMIDIDHFKSINDTHGHGVGDEVICAVASCLQQSARKDDFVGRYGGEEFVLVIPDTTLEEGYAFAERLRKTILLLPQSVNLSIDRLTVSIGLSLADPDLEAKTIDQLLEQADQALYGAKESGRNRVISYDPDTIALLESNKQEDKLKAIDGTEMCDAAAGGDSVDMVQAIVARHRTELDMLKTHNVLTGLPKRPLFMESVNTEIERARLNDRTMAVVLIQVKELERIQTFVGPAHANDFVKLIVVHIRNSLRVSEKLTGVIDDRSLSQLSDNQFGIVFPDFTGIEDVLAVLVRMRRLLLEPVIFQEQTIYPGFNMGIGVYPDVANTADDLVKSASLALRQSQELPEKVAYNFASRHIADKSREYFTLEADLYQAIKSESLTVKFQPKFDLCKRSITSLESLVRWHHPLRGDVSPDIFVPIAESNGLVARIFQQVLTASLAQLVAWDKAGLSGLQVSVNLSAVQLRDKRLPDYVLGMLDKYGLAPERLDLELTETAIIKSPALAKKTLLALHNAGISISLDDFGTGYTSLALLSDTPLSTVKIDRSFISTMEQNKRNYAIVHSVIQMAHALKLKVVAEGVETPEQLDLLKTMSCDLVQGFIISKPLNGSDVLSLLLQETNKA